MRHKGSPVDTTSQSDEVLRTQTLTPGARRILEIASELFYRRGIHAVGVDTIAAESGITKRTLYDRFGSKEGLVETYLKTRHERWWDRMERRLSDQPASRVLAVWDSYVHDTENSDRGCAFINAAGELPDGHPAHHIIRAHKHAVHSRLTDLIRTDHPQVDDTKSTADQIFLLLEGGITHRGIDGDDRMLRSGRAIAEQLICDESKSNRAMPQGSEHDASASARPA